MKNYLEHIKQNEQMAKLVAEAHSGQMYGDKPYTYHLYQVEHKVAELFKAKESTIDDIANNYILSTVALGHDLVEDTCITCEDLGKLCFDQEVITAISFLTKRDSQSRNEYLKALSLNNIAWKVKVADTLCNLEESMKIQDIKRIRKYSNQLNTLYKLKG